MGSNIGRHQTLQSEDRLFSCQIRDTTAIQADPRPTNWVALGAKTPWPLPPIAMLTRGVFPCLRDTITQLTDRHFTLVVQLKPMLGNKAWSLLLHVHASTFP